MKIAIVRERADGETRVAATPESVQKLAALGGSVVIEAGAGAQADSPTRTMPRPARPSWAPRRMPSPAPTSSSPCAGRSPPRSKAWRRGRW